MRELALHILDVVENALQAGARTIELIVLEDYGLDRLTITVRDDGRGMDAETVKKVRDPFYTTRMTRHVGLGIPLLDAAAERCAGGLEIQSTPGRGTTLTATVHRMITTSIDCSPMFPSKIQEVRGLFTIGVSGSGFFSVKSCSPISLS